MGIISRYISQRWQNRVSLAVQLLSKFNILIKDCSGKAAFAGGEYIRIAVRDRDDNHRLAEALKEL